MTDNGMATSAHTLGNIHRAIIASHAKDNGMNKSEALRDIIDRWADAQISRGSARPQTAAFLLNGGEGGND